MKGYSVFSGYGINNSLLQTDYFLRRGVARCVDDDEGLVPINLGSAVCSALEPNNTPVKLRVEADRINVFTDDGEKSLIIQTEDIDGNRTGGDAVRKTRTRTR